ncbi:hypothetical protein GCM10027594_29110 [Hymenobacter agri]
MATRLPVYAAALLLGSYCAAPAAHAQSSFAGAPGAVIGLAHIISAQKKAHDELIARTITTATYRGESFPMKRCPDDIMAGDAADRIAQLETQLAACNKALLADSTSLTCPAEQQAAIRANLNYISGARPGWSLQPYRQELKFYVAEDKRRERIAASTKAK